MKILKSLAVAGSIWAGAGLVASPSSAAPDPNFHIYIAFGQSNMAGASAAQDP